MGSRAMENTGPKMEQNGVRPGPIAKNFCPQELQSKENCWNLMASIPVLSSGELVTTKMAVPLPRSSW